MNRSFLKFQYALSTMVVILFFIIALTSCEDKDEPPVENLIAHYPLETDANDITGNNGPITLSNAPFQSGSVYCNGVYTSAGGPVPDGCVVQTPAIPLIDFGSFAISVEFNAEELRNQPVWVVGNCAQWLGFATKLDGTIYMSYNNNETLSTTTTYSINQWHTAKIVYDNTTASIYLDDILAGSIPTQFILCSEDDTIIGVTNYSNGGVFKGNIKNLKVFRVE